MLMPVTLPPGLARLWTNPAPTRSPVRQTIGIVLVASLAILPASAPDAKIKSIFCEIRLETVFDTASGEAALAGLPAMMIVSPSTKPNWRKPSLSASIAP
jgi:hypothetical protein